MTQQGNRPGIQSASMYEPQESGPEEYGRDGSRGAPGEVMDRAREGMDTAREQMNAAGERVEEGRERLAEGASNAADRVREQAEERGGVQRTVGLKAADSMEQAATYLRDHRTDEMWADLERYAKEHPMQAVGGAVVAGFVLGRILR